MLDGAAELALSGMNFGPLPMGNGLTRLATRFHGDVPEVLGQVLDAAKAYGTGLVTAIPDELDWDEEIRLAVEERAAFNPDALTGMEANHRFTGPETLETKIFGRLSAWQNWVFQRPNAGAALGCYGTGRRPDFDRRRA